MSDPLEEQDIDNLSIDELKRQRDALLEKKSQLQAEITQLKYKDEGIPQNILVDLYMISDLKNQSKSDNVADSEDDDLSLLAQYNSTLPLTDMKIRLQYLERTYPFTKVELLEENNTFQISYSRNEIPLSVSFEIDSDSKEERLNYIKVIDISRESPLSEIYMDNFQAGDKVEPSVLFSLWELDRIYFERNEIYNKLKEQYGNLVNLEDGENIEIDRNLERLKLVINWKISFNMKNVKSILKSMVFKDGIEIEGSNEIFKELVKLYGIEKGCAEFVKAIGN